ncbi:MAG: hypothetical protein IJW62_02165 [Clostridia bacterium]|nr:hypothetical protein [Clostridia bacterium]
MKKIVSILLLITLTLLVACSGGVSRSQATDATESFVSYILEKDSHGALSLMHPDAAAVTTAEKCEAIVNAFTAAGVDFSAVPEYHYTGFRVSMYDSRYSGSGYELSGYIILGEIRVDVMSVVVSNDNGFGIYSINFDFPTDLPATEGDDGVASPL